MCIHLKNIQAMIELYSVLTFKLEIMIVSQLSHHIFLCLKEPSGIFSRILYLWFMNIKNIDFILEIFSTWYGMYHF